MTTGADVVEDPPATDREKGPRWRRIVAALLVVVGCILVPISVLGVWTRNTLLNSEQYVATVAPLAKDPAVVERVTFRATEAILASADVEENVKDVLPDRAVVLAAPIAQAVEQLVGQVVERVVDSQRFRKLWRQANERAHEQVVKVLTGEGKLVGEEGQVVVELGPVVEDALAKLESTGLDIFANVGDRVEGNTLVLFESEDLAKVQGAVDLLDTLAIVLPILALVLFAAGIAISTNRRLTLLRAALGVALGMALLLTLFNVLRGAYLDAFPAEGQDAAEAAYDQILSFLITSTRAAFSVAIVIAIGAWLVGPSRGAVRIREFGRRVIGSTAAEGEGQEPSRVATFVDRYRTPLRVVVLGIAAIALMAISQPTGVTVLVVAVLVLVAIGVIEFLARGASRVPDPSAKGTSR